MDAGYRIHLEHVSEERSPISRSSVSIRPPFLPIPEYTQLSEHTIFHSDAELKLNHERGWSHTANNVKGEAIAKHVLRALLLPLTILLLLVPGFLLSVEHVRNGNYHSERTSWRDQDPFIKSRDGERPQVAIDIAGLGSLQPVAASEKHGNKVEKCDGWRDWIDVYVGGWKGCTM